MVTTAAGGLSFFSPSFCSGAAAVEVIAATGAADAAMAAATTTGAAMMTAAAAVKGRYRAGFPALFFLKAKSKQKNRFINKINTFALK